MPIIPLYNEGQSPALPQSPGPQLQQGSSLRVNYAGVAQNFASPDIPKEIADRSGDMAAGQGMANAGRDVAQVMGELKARTDDAINTKKVADATNTMHATAGDFEAWKVTNPDPSKWESEWEQRSTTLHDALMQEPLSTPARVAVQARYDQFHTLQTIDNKVGAAKKAFADAGDALHAQGIQLAEAGDLAGYRTIQATRVQKGYVNPAQAAAEEVQTKAAIKGKTLQSIATQIDTDAKDGTLARLPMLLDKAREAGAEEYQTKGWEQTATKQAADFQTTKQHEDQSKVLGSLMLQRANGLEIDPKGINMLVSKGYLSESAGAELVDSAKRQLGADDSDFGPFITRVMKYDPNADRAKLMQDKYDLQLEATKMGLNPAQASRFSDVFDMAVKLNGTPDGRVQSALKTWGREHIEEMHKTGGIGVTWKAPAVGVDDVTKAALADPQKMAKVLGVTLIPDSKGTARDIATEISQTVKLDPQKALSLFAKAAKVPQPDSGLDAGSYNYLIKAAKKTDDLAAKAQSGATAADLQQKFEDQFDSITRQNKGVPPTKEQVQGMVNKLVSPFNDHLTWGKLMLPAAAPAPAASGGITIRGYQDAPDLADNLPTNLKPYAADFVAAGKKYGLDPHALAAISMHETDNGTSHAFTAKNNAMGSSDDNGPLTFGSVPESIERQARTLANPNGPYKGADTIDQVSKVYAPVGAVNDQRGLNGSWPSGVSHFYNRLHLHR